MENPFARLTEFKVNVGEYGIVYSVREEIKRRGGVIESQASSSTRESLGQRPCMVVGLHPRRYEAAPILAGLPSRRDFFFLGNSFYNRFAETLGGQYLPLYVRREMYSLRSWFNYLIGFSHNNGSKSQPNPKNVRNLTSAAQRVNDGGIGLIFPDNFYSRDDSWKSGVGHLVGQIEHPEACVVFARAIGNAHPARLLPGVSQLAPYHAVVNYSDPINVPSIPDIKNGSGRAITRFLEECYDDWLEEISET